MGLPTIMGENLREVEEFYKRLVYNMQSLETLGKLRDLEGNVRAVLDKLKGIKSDLVRGHEHWQEWDVRQLLLAIKRWKDVNPVTEASESEIQQREPACIPKGKNDKNDGLCARDPIRPDRMLEYRRMGVSTVIRPVTFQEIVPELPQLETETCRSRRCHNCQRKHHTSICEQTNNESVGRFLTAQDKGTGKVIYAVVLVEVNGIKCRALLDTGAGSSYVSSAILDHLRIRPLREEFKCT